MANLLARHLRAAMTDAERVLLARLRKKSTWGLRIRRQVPLGPFIADFACHAARLVIEVDGAQHAEPGGLSHDAKRTVWLEQQGYCVIRFWNADVLRDPDAAAEAVGLAIKQRMRELGRPLPRSE